MKTMRKILKSTRGQSMVEMAIMLPLLLLMFFYIFEFGLILGSYVLIHDLARDGVRAGVVGDNEAAIETHIKAHAVFLDTNRIEVNTYINDTLPDVYTDRKVGDSLTVRIDYDHNVISPFIGIVVGDSVHIPAEYTMRIERVVPQST